jgi:hypothetical protein
VLELGDLHVVRWVVVLDGLIIAVEAILFVGFPAQPAVDGVDMQVFQCGLVLVKAVEEELWRCHSAMD